MFEVDHGKWILSYEPKKKLPIEDFLREQGRFKHLFKKGNEHLIEQFQVMEPFGKGNKRPLFAEKDLKVIQPKIVGKNENVLQCILEDKQGNRMKAVYFGDVKTCLKEMLAGKVTAVTYFPSINEYMGRRSIQLTIVNYQKK